MFTRPRSKPALSMAASALTLLLALGSFVARADGTVEEQAAGTRTRDVSYTGANGKQATTHKVTRKTDTGHTSTTTLTNAKGETATRNAVVTNDKDNGTRTRDVTYTGVNGKTSTVNSVTKRTGTGNTRTTTATGPNGSSETRVTSLACDRSIGNCNLDATHHGPDGGKH